MNIQKIKKRKQLFAFFYKVLISSVVFDVLSMHFSKIEFSVNLEISIEPLNATFSIVTFVPIIANGDTMIYLV